MSQYNSGPTTAVGTSFDNFYQDFNLVGVKQDNYSRIKQYLADRVTMVRVDDFDSIMGTKEYIVTYLNQTQGKQAATPQWPQFNPTSGTIVVDSVHGTVTGQGTYQDTVGGTAIPVNFSFRFKQDSSNDWLIGYASATPAKQDTILD